MASSSPLAANNEEFSLPLFAFTLVLTFCGLCGLLWGFLPEVWEAQFLPPFWKAVVAFGAISLVLCFFEYFFHRYLLHTSAVPFLRRLYRQHARHHALTRIARKRTKDGRHLLHIENKFPIVEVEQHEAAFFPWYAMAAFGGLLAPLLALLHFVFPGFPWFLAGFAALASSLSLYEVLHAINHWPLEKWEPLVTHPRWSWLWRPIYGFHLRHHAVIDCNESISGFFGLPIADWVFGTCVVPQTVYADGEEWSPEKFSRPRPRALIRMLDGWADRAMRRRRTARREGNRVGGGAGRGRRVYSRGEEVANGLTHGVGTILSLGAAALLVGGAMLRGEGWHVATFAVFGFTLLLLYTVSTLYHTRRSLGSRALFRRFDHAAIFLLIAGTYTPFLLTELRGAWGWSLFGAIWAICGAGAAIKLVHGERFRRLSLLAYLVAGWLILVAVKPLIISVPMAALWLLLAGGLSYSVGVLFYVWRRLRYHHAIWHLFVLGGSACHVLAVLFLLQPTAV